MPLTERIATLGTDPEFFLVHKTSGRPVPAHRFFPDKSSKRELVAGQSKVFRDGYAIELNLIPHRCRETMAYQMYHALAILRRELDAANLRLTTLPAVEIDLKADLDGAPDDVLHFGCDPAWDAYTGTPNTVPLDGATHGFRYAGGHMHLGLDAAWLDPELRMPGILEDDRKLALKLYGWMKNAEQVALFIRMCDLYIGVPLSYWFAKPETFARREYYGKAGEFRFQEYGVRKDTGGPVAYGVEYRTPGPELWNAPPVSSLMFGVFRTLAYNFVEMSKTWNAGREQYIREAINTGVGLRTLMTKMPGWYEANLFDTGGALAARPFQELSIYDPENELSNYGVRGWSYFLNQKYDAASVFQGAKILSQNR